jgi:chromosome segregation ATPase
VIQDLASSGAANDQLMTTSGTGGEPGRSGSELERQIDALSLNQALLDFELANARVLDLTARLVEANTRVMRYQSETDALRADLAGFQARLDAAHSAVTTSAQTTEAAQAEVAAAGVEVLSAQAERDAAKTQTALVSAELAATHNSRTFRIARKLKSLPGLGRVVRVAKMARR